MRAHIPSSETDADRPDDPGFEPDVVYLSPEEWLVLFEREVRDELGIGAAEFVRRYRAGEYEDHENPLIDLFAVSVGFYEAVIGSE